MIGPNDLIAFVTFDGHVYANQAVTRERLGQPPEPAHALKAALAHWLRRRHVWMDVEGRHIQGIATARPPRGPQRVGARHARGRGRARRGGERGPLAAAAGPGRRPARWGSRTCWRGCARTPPAVVGAMRAGFTQALGEQLWRAPVLRGLADARPRDHRRGGNRGRHARPVPALLPRRPRDGAQRDRDDAARVARDARGGLARPPLARPRRAGRRRWWSGWRGSRPRTAAPTSSCSPRPTRRAPRARCSLPRPRVSRAGTRCSRSPRPWPAPPPGSFARRGSSRTRSTWSSASASRAPVEETVTVSAGVAVPGG